MKKKKSVRTKGECFTIMPFGGWFDDYYEDIFVPAIKAGGLVPRRADDLYRPSAIVHDIWAYTRSAKLILADLSGKNPNVFYELGLAHAIAKLAVLVTQSIEDVPFDLRSLRVIDYDKNGPAWGEDLKVKIKTAIEEVLASPAKSVLPSFLEVSASPSKIPITEQQKEMLDLRQELESLRSEIRRSSDSGSRRITYSEAKMLIERLVKEGRPIRQIVQIMAERGAPESWIVGEISRLRREAKPSSSRKA